MLVASILIFACFLLYQSITERSALLIALGSQEQPLQQAQQAKAQLDALASATAALADQGDKGAKEIIDSLKSQGISVRQ
jgi:hypothetical protein